MDLGGIIVEVNDTYLDIGNSNFGKAFQTRAMIGLCMGFIVSCLLVLPTIMGFSTFNNPFGRNFSWYFSEFFESGMWISGWGGAAFAIIGCYVVISSTLTNSRTRPIRFNRQHREVCFFPNNSDDPVIQPWEEMVSWLSVSTGSTGVGTMSTYTFGMAFDDPKADKVHFVNQAVATPIHGLGTWEAIRVYMEKGPQYCPGKVPYEGRHTFDQERADMHEEYRHNERSALGVGWWYFSHVMTWWRFPYWVAEWDHGYSMKSLPDSISDWSRPLPAEQWVKPSAELNIQSARIEKAFAQGKSFSAYFETGIKPE
nr:DUF6708 domain-containing protein [Pseudomonas migulae]